MAKEGYIEQLPAHRCGVCRRCYHCDNGDHYTYWCGRDKVDPKVGVCDVFQRIDNPEREVPYD